MPTIICPKCGKPFYLDPFTYWNYSGDVKCTNCGAVMAVEIKEGQLLSTPILKELKVHNVPFVPESINDDFLEAQLCHAVGAYKACVVMCRRALEQMCDDMNAKGDTLYQKIKDLQTKGIILSEIADIFNEIRYFGNYGAHPKNDLLEGVTEEDSATVLEITLHILKHIYEVPQKLKKLRRRRGESV